MTTMTTNRSCSASDNNSGFPDVVVGGGDGGVGDIGVLQHHHHERSPLLLSSNHSSQSEGCESDVYDNSNSNDVSASSLSKASNWQTALNLMKTCMGTGCLALPFACQQGGLVLFVTGLLAVAAWNVYSVQRLVACLDYLPVSVIKQQQTYRHDSDGEEDDDVVNVSGGGVMAEAEMSSLSAARPPPPPGISVLGQVAWCAFGPAGVEALDGMMLSLFLGVIVAYFCALITFLADTPLSMGTVGDGIVTTIILSLISLVPHVGALKHASALGLAVLFFTFVVIFGYGIWGHAETQSSSHNNIQISITPTSPPTPAHLLLLWWPQSMSGLSQWFGVVVFGFGVVPMTYNFRSSMRRPECMVSVTGYAMAATALLYIAMGVGLYVLYPTLTGDILSELPTNGFLPNFTRLAMVLVVFVTAPLLIVPCAEMLQGKWLCCRHQPHSQAHSATQQQHRHSNSAIFIRISICVVCCLVAIAFPNFVQALSLVGSTCVAAVGFGLPSLLHLRLVLLHYGGFYWTREVMVDSTLLLFGVCVTVLSTYYTLGNMKEHHAAAA